MVEITILAHHEAVLENGAGSIHIILTLRFQLPYRPDDLSLQGFSRFWSTVFPAAPGGAGFASGGHATPGDALFSERFRRHFSLRPSPCAIANRGYESTATTILSAIRCSKTDAANAGLPNGRTASSCSTSLASLAAVNIISLRMESVRIAATGARRPIDAGHTRPPSIFRGPSHEGPRFSSLPYPPVPPRHRARQSSRHMQRHAAPSTRWPRTNGTQLSGWKKR